MTDLVKESQIEFAESCESPWHSLRTSLRQFYRRPDANRSPLARVQIRVEGDPLRWLRQQTTSPKIYWADRENRQKVAGIGAVRQLCITDALDYADVFNEARRWLSSDLRWYGGIRFHPWQQYDQLWQSHACCHFVIPRFEMSSRQGQTWLAVNFAPRVEKLDWLLAALDKVKDEADCSNEIALPQERVDTPGYRRWCDNVENALENLRTEELRKIVLARKAEFRFAETIDPIAILQRLAAATINAFHFLFEFEAGSAFLGASPECLFRRNDRAIYSEAIAGTRMRGNTEMADRQLANELLNSDKDRREHSFVVDNIAEALGKLCQHLDHERQPKILQLQRLQHLWAPFHGRLHEGVEDAQILAALHPTAAVCGYPRDKAWKQLVQLEGFDRGWYAGPVGWIGQDAAEFAVAIRSGLIHGANLTSFSGAGIVPGSDPDAEWREIESKIGNFLGILTRDGN